MAVERLGLGAAEGGPATDDAFEWTESRYGVRVALEREVIDRPPKRGKLTLRLGITSIGGTFP